MSGSQHQDRGMRSTADSFIKDLVAGGVSGIVAKTIAAPIERVKLLLQTQTINTGLAVQYRNPIDCTLRIYRNEGILAFWRGNLANVYRYFPSQAMNFAFKGSYSQFFGRLASAGDGTLTATEKKYRRMGVSLLSGGLAGATSLAVSYPFDVARTRLAVDVRVDPPVPPPGPGSHRTAVPTAASKGPAPHSGTRALSTSALNSAAQPTGVPSSSNSGSHHGSRAYGGTFDCLRRTYQAEGLRGVYAGFGVSLAGVFVFRALYLGGYDIVKDHYGLEHTSRTARFVAAQAVTTVVGTLCFPIDTVKRRLMVQHSLSAPPMTTTVSTTTSATGAHGSTVVGTAPLTLPPSAQAQGQGRVPYKGGWDCARRIVREEGVRGLFVGLSVNLVRGFSGAVLLVAYDELKRYL